MAPQGAFKEVGSLICPHLNADEKTESERDSLSHQATNVRVRLDMGTEEWPALPPMLVCLLQGTLGATEGPGYTGLGMPGSHA